MATPTEEARRQVIEAREALGGDLDEVVSAARSAVDIPAKIRKNLLQTAALATGAGFLALGGPKRALKAVASRVRPPRARRPHEGLLPKEIDQVVKKKGGDHAPEIQEALEDDFAQYLSKKGDATASEPSGTRSLWKTYDTVLGRIGPMVAKQLAEQLFAADPKRSRSAAAADSPDATEAASQAPSGAGRGGSAGLSGLGARIRKGTKKSA